MKVIFLTNGNIFEFLYFDYILIPTSFLRSASVSINPDHLLFSSRDPSLGTPPPPHCEQSQINVKLINSFFRLCHEIIQETFQSVWLHWN